MAAPGSADGGCFHIVVDERHVLRKVVGEHLNKLFSLRIVSVLIVPRPARIEQHIRNTGQLGEEDDIVAAINAFKETFETSAEVE